VDSEVNLTITHGNAQIKLGAGKCDGPGCNKNGGGMAEVNLTLPKEDGETGVITLILCGDCLLNGTWRTDENVWRDLEEAMSQRRRESRI